MGETGTFLWTVLEDFIILSLGEDVVEACAKCILNIYGGVLVTPVNIIKHFDNVKHLHTCSCVGRP